MQSYFHYCTIMNVTHSPPKPYRKKLTRNQLLTQSLNSTWLIPRHFYHAPVLELPIPTKTSKMLTPRTFSNRSDSNTCTTWGDSVTRLRMTASPQKSLMMKSLNFRALPEEKAVDSSRMLISGYQLQSSSRTEKCRLKATWPHKSNIWPNSSKYKLTLIRCQTLR